MDHCCSSHQILVCLFHSEDVQQMLLMASPRAQQYFLKLTCFMDQVSSGADDTNVGGPSILILQLSSFLCFLRIKNNIVLFTLTCYNMCIHNCRRRMSYLGCAFPLKCVILVQILHQGGRKEGCRVLIHWSWRNFSWTELRCLFQCPMDKLLYPMHSGLSQY